MLYVEYGITKVKRFTIARSRTLVLWGSSLPSKSIYVFVILANLPATCSCNFVCCCSYFSIPFNILHDIGLPTACWDFRF